MKFSALSSRTQQHEAIERFEVSILKANSQQSLSAQWGREVTLQAVD
jgi:hypothetical protein